MHSIDSKSFAAKTPDMNSEIFRLPDLVAAAVVVRSGECDW